MTVQDLILRLQNFKPDFQVMILDAPNDDGVPRRINFGPVYQYVDFTDADQTADCEELVGQDVVLLGFGCY